MQGMGIPTSGCFEKQISLIPFVSDVKHDEILNAYVFTGSETTLNLFRHLNDKKVHLSSSRVMISIN